jgi:hypothetical protein
VYSPREWKASIYNDDHVTTTLAKALLVFPTSYCCPIIHDFHDQKGVLSGEQLNALLRMDSECLDVHECMVWACTRFYFNILERTTLLITRFVKTPFILVSAVENTWPLNPFAVVGRYWKSL